MKLNKLDSDVIVIGAGPAGSIAAMKLIQGGLSVTVLEKNQFPRFVIGESLLPKSMDFFEDLGLIELLEQEGFQKKTGALFCNDDGDVCDFLFNNKHADGWDTTWQVSRDRFDHLLIQEAENRGADVLFNVSVCEFKNKDDCREIIYKDSAGAPHTIKGKFVIDASGYGRVLPRLLGLIGETKSAPRSAVYCRLKDVNRPKEISNNILHHTYENNRSWSWTIPLSDGTTSVGLIGPTEDLDKWISNNGEYFYNIFKGPETFGNRFKNAEIVMPFRYSSNYASKVTQLYGPGYVLCGNATEFLDPIFSSGVCLAVSSGHKAAELVISELKNDEQVDWENDYSNYLKRGIDVYRSYVEAWYEGSLKTIFFTKQFNEEHKRQVCSVLAGFVWDDSNPFVVKHKRILDTLAKVIRLTEAA